MELQNTDARIGDNIGYITFGNDRDKIDLTLIKILALSAENWCCHHIVGTDRVKLASASFNLCCDLCFCSFFLDRNA